MCISRFYEQRSRIDGRWHGIRMSDSKGQHKYVNIDKHNRLVKSLTEDQQLTYAWASMSLTDRMLATVLLTCCAFAMLKSPTLTSYTFAPVSANSDPSRPHALPYAGKIRAIWSHAEEGTRINNCTQTSQKKGERIKHSRH